MSKPNLEVCLSPALLHLYDTTDTVVVIIDVLRATSTMPAALYNGAARIIPVSSVEECISRGLSTPNSITAGERNGIIAPGLQNGNSPLEYHPEFIKGKTLILTTTNGTKLLHMVKERYSIITGSFLNFSAVCSYLLKEQKNVLLACAGWKDKVNMEDTAFAGAVANKLKDDFEITCDSAMIAMHLATSAAGDYVHFLEPSSHFNRLKGFGLMKDLQHCLSLDGYPVVPVLKGEELVAL